jgi:hypothetical protein
MSYGWELSQQQDEELVIGHFSSLIEMTNDK